ncbi:uncharacterized protein IL334_003876 [Kwoniella shivajii]|uniref:Uncharacterized protein n=1 Tax=Kwoniella shivajii TaxID=564305 RepID=A0ABZ1CYS4_9TREE|nr:hypothetical protein IL334_003876 [Kwoniella shivajii]
MSEDNSTTGFPPDRSDGSANESFCSIPPHPCFLLNLPPAPRTADTANSATDGQHQSSNGSGTKTAKDDTTDGGTENTVADGTEARTEGNN